MFVIFDRTPRPDRNEADFIVSTFPTFAPCAPMQVVNQRLECRFRFIKGQVVGNLFVFYKQFSNMEERAADLVGDTQDGLVNQVI